MTQNEINLIKSFTAVFASLHSGSREISLPDESPCDVLSLLSLFLKLYPLPNTPDNKQSPPDNSKGFVLFSKKELAMLPQSFQKYFIHNNQIVRYRFYRGMYQARFFKRGYHIEVASSDFDTM